MGKGKDAKKAVKKEAAKTPKEKKAEKRMKKAMKRKLEHMRLGQKIFITAFILSTILGGIFIAVTRHKRNKGDFVPAGHEGNSLAWLLPYNPWLAAPVLGILGACLAVPLLLGLFFLFNVSALSPIHYAAIKGIWAAALATFMVPIAILQGLRSK